MFPFRITQIQQISGNTYIIVDIYYIDDDMEDVSHIEEQCTVGVVKHDHLGLGVWSSTTFWAWGCGQARPSGLGVVFCQIFCT